METRDVEAEFWRLAHRFYSQSAVEPPRWMVWAGVLTLVALGAAAFDLARGWLS